MPPSLNVSYNIVQLFSSRSESSRFGLFFSPFLCALPKNFPRFPLLPNIKSPTYTWWYCIQYIPFWPTIIHSIPYFYKNWICLSLHIDSVKIYLLNFPDFKFSVSLLTSNDTVCNATFLKVLILSWLTSWLCWNEGLDNLHCF